MGPSSAASTSSAQEPAISPGTATPSSSSSPEPPTRKTPRPARTAASCASRPSGWACPTDLVPLATTGTVKENARILCDWLAVQPDRPVILASLSKGGPEIKVALAEPDADTAFRNVVAWISLCGILDGTPMADWLLSKSPGAVRGPSLLPAARQEHGLPPRAALPFRRPAGPSAAPAIAHPIDQRRRLPPARAPDPPLSRSCHERLTPLGPNDGALVLGDVCALPGLIYPVWGADHYLQPKGAPARWCGASCAL